MNLRNVIKEVMHIRGYTLEKLQTKLGYKTLSGVSERIRKGNMKIDTLLKFGEILDFEVVIRSTLKDKAEWKITPDNDE